MNYKITFINKEGAEVITISHEARTAPRLGQSVSKRSMSMKRMFSGHVVNVSGSKVTAQM